MAGGGRCGGRLGWLIGAAALLLACAARSQTIHGHAPEPWTLRSLIKAAQLRAAPRHALPPDPIFDAAATPPTPWQAGFTLPTDPDRMLRPLAYLMQIRTKNALVTQRLDTLWAVRTRVRDALVDYCEARELAGFLQHPEEVIETRLAALGGAAFVPLAELQAGVVLCTDFDRLPPPADDETLLRAAFARRTDYLAAVENYLMQKSLWHRRRGAPPQPSGATLAIAYPVGSVNEAVPATLEVALRHRLLVREVRDYGADYRGAYQETTKAIAGSLGRSRVAAWYQAQRALTPLEDATRSVLDGADGLAKPW